VRKNEGRRMVKAVWEAKEIIKKLETENRRLKEENFQLRKLLRAIQFLTKGCLPTELVEELRKK